LNSNGTLDLSFTPPDLTYATSNIILKDSAIFVATTAAEDNSANAYLYKLKPDGSLDTSFHHTVLNKFGYADFCMGFAENNIIFNNSSTTSSRYGISKCDSVGKLINTFTPEAGRYGIINTGKFFNNNLTIGGDFVKVNGFETYGVARLNIDGSIDSSFSLTKNMGTPTQLNVINDTIILVSAKDKFFKLNSKAEIQTDFNFSRFKELYQVIKFKVLENKKIIAGYFYNIYRLNADGTEDNSFDIGTGICCTTSTAFDFDLQGDKIIYGSIFTEFNGTIVNQLIRLKSDASVDNTFDIGSGPDKGIAMIKVLESGEILVGGYFNNFNGVSVPNSIVKLSQNGAMDISFNENQKTGTFAESVHLLDAKVQQTGSKVFIRQSNSILALSTDGTIDNSFDFPFYKYRVNDIVTMKKPLPSLGGKKSIIINNSEVYLFAIGAFYDPQNFDPAFIVKLDLGKVSDTTGSNDAIKKVNISQFELYPNPVNDFLRIGMIGQTGRYNVTIYNVSGEKVFESMYINDINNSLIEVNVRNLLPGLYLLKLSSGSGDIVSKKFMKVK